MLYHDDTKLATVNNTIAILNRKSCCFIIIDIFPGAKVGVGPALLVHLVVHERGGICVVQLCRMTKIQKLWIVERMRSPIWIYDGVERVDPRKVQLIIMARFFGKSVPHDS
jgi:hypothetical protein